MIILSLKTDQPESEFALFNDHERVAEIKYLAHKDLADTIHLKIVELLKSQNLDWQNIEGVICFKGPGSFTGLRIGLSVANSLAYGLDIPIVGEQDNDWQTKAINKLLQKQNDKTVMPFYGAEPNITKPKK
ncbi:MAG: tRNA (adenosine(37)-N6)-threonylcarbamoyltransferase complex dimerization subunit type 1 TsaB [Candidatus Saccharibacteria bacterium]